MEIKPHISSALTGKQLSYIRRARGPRDLPALAWAPHSRVTLSQAFLGSASSSVIGLLLCVKQDKDCGKNFANLWALQTCNVMVLFVPVRFGRRLFLITVPRVTELRSETSLTVGLRCDLQDQPGLRATNSGSRACMNRMQFCHQIKFTEADLTPT